MSFQNLTRGEVHAGFSALARMGADEDDWREMTNNEDVARRVVEQLQQYKTTSDEPIKPRSILSRIVTGLALPATKGKRLLSQQKDLFPGWIDSDFTNYGCDVAGEAKPETQVDVYELAEDATFKQMFEGQDINQLCLTQDQTASFVENHRGHLHPKGYATFFLFKVRMEVEGEMKDQFFVAFVYWDGVARKLMVYVRRFSGGRVWRASSCRRFVLPQLAV